MKLSRRGKLARRRKHTKRAGKHLRYKTKSKKFRASKRYHRGNKRTYKRGKRFHRGGSIIELGSVLLEYKKNDGNFLTTSDTKMFTAQFYTVSNELHLKRCSGNTKESCNSRGKSPILFILQNAALTLTDFNNNTIDLVLKGHDSSGNLLNVNYTFFGNTLNKSSFNSLLSRINTLTTKPSNSPLESTIFASSAVQASAAAQSTAIGQGDRKIDYYTEYRLPITLGGDMSPSYNNYVGRFKLVTDTSTPQLYDVYYSGELGDDDYRNGFIHLFAVRSNPRTSNAKRIYILEYNISSKPFLVFTERDFSKIKNIYENRESTGRFTLNDTPAVTEIIDRLDQISKTPHREFYWQDEARNNDEQQNGWKPE